MTQTRGDKVAALKRLLPLLVGYLLDSPKGRTVARIGRTSSGGAYGDTDSLGWLTLKEEQRKQYRMAAVSQSLAKLYCHNRQWAWAVWYTWVDPWERWETRRREEWANEGIRWMVDEIPGRLWAPGDVRPRKEKKEDKREAARLLREDGVSRDEVTRRLHMSARDVPKVTKEET